MKKIKQIFMISLVFLVSGCFNFGDFFNNKNKDKDKEETINLNTNTTETISNEELTELYLENVKTTVTVFKYGDNGSSSSGSGVVVSEKDDYAYIYTNAHVVDGSYSSLEVVFYNNKRASATLVVKDNKEDTALLKVNKSNNYTVATLGKSDSLKIGQGVFAIGSPLGMNYSKTMTAGVISGLNIKVETNSIASKSRTMYMIQIDAALNPGNSGGPLFNIYGELIGINSLKIVYSDGVNLNDGETPMPIESFNFSIPIDHFKLVIETLLENGSYSRPLVGVSIQDISTMSLASRTSEGISEEVGLYVAEVVSGGPSHAIIYKKDVIVGINNIDIISTSEFAVEINKFLPGDPVEIKLVRNNTVKIVTVVLGEQSE